MLKYELRVASENNAKCIEIPVPFIHFKYVNEEHWWNCKWKISEILVATFKT